MHQWLQFVASLQQQMPGIATIETSIRYDRRGHPASFLASAVATIGRLFLAALSLPYGDLLHQLHIAGHFSTSICMHFSANSIRFKSKKLWLQLPRNCDPTAARLSCGPMRARHFHASNYGNRMEVARPSSQSRCSPIAVVTHILRTTARYFLQLRLMQRPTFTHDAILMP